MKSHSSVSTRVLDVLVTAGSSLLSKHIDALIQFFNTLKPEEFDSHLITFLSNMAKAQLRETRHKLAFFYLLWSLVDNESNKLDLCTQALKELDKLIGLPEFSLYRSEWIQLLIPKCKQFSASVALYYHLLGSILASYPRKHQLPQPAAGDNNTTQESLAFIFMNYLIGLIFFSMNMIDLRI